VWGASRSWRSPAIPSTSHDTTELWLVDLEGAAPALAALEAETPRLAADDRARALRLGDARERRHRLAAYVALRIAIERIAGPTVRGMSFRRAAGGKPHLPGIAFSLSHADGVALIGVTRAGTIGVDLEPARTVRVSARRRAEIVAAGAGLGARAPELAGADAAFLQAWSRLEAYAKARGHGLAAALLELGLRGTGGAQRTATPLASIETRARALARRAGLTVADLALPAGLYGAVALAGPARIPPAQPFPTARPAIAALLLPPPKPRRRAPG
jgi:4'-phosphopantetheinyl transferase